MTADYYDYDERKGREKGREGNVYVRRSEGKKCHKLLKCRIGSDQK